LSLDLLLVPPPPRSWDYKYDPLHSALKAKFLYKGLAF
jgi:hypothetical protein